MPPDSLPTYAIRPVMTRGDRLLHVFLSGVLVYALVQFGLYWTRAPEWATHPVTMAGLSAVLLLFVAQYLQSWTTLPAMRRPEPPPPEVGSRVALVTTFVPGAESLAMLETTLRAMVEVRLHHDVWVLDEADDLEVEALCRRVGARHFSRRGRRELNARNGPLRARTKYGNLNAWLREVGFDGYDVVAAFDPDHVPAPVFLERTLGYLRDPGVGFVQAAQVYYNQDASFIARGAAEETYGYYSSTLMAAFGAGYAVVVGCHSVHRVEALRAIGGFAPHDADDLLTALHYDAAGWRGVYVPEVLAVGLTPVAWPAYLVQQRRWARSVFDIKIRHLPKLWSRLRPATRLFALAQGAGYPIDAILPSAGSLILAWILVSGEASVLSRLFGHQFLLLLLVLGGINLLRQRFFLLPRIEQGLHWRAGVLRAAKWPFVAWGLTEALFGVRRPYEVTAKEGTGPRLSRLLLPHLGMAAVVGAAYGSALVADRVAHGSLHLWAPLVAATSLAIFLSGFVARPLPFERSLLRRWRARCDEVLPSAPPSGEPP